jgi:cytosine/adenosine deaminase-related metal-dependent hydrolase
VTDLVVQGVRDIDGSIRDIAVVGSEIAAAPAPGSEVIDGSGWLTIPRVADIHVHLDKTLLGEPWIPHHPTDSLDERARREQELLESDRVAPLAVRAARLVRLAASRGTTLMQSHVDVADSGGVGRVETLLQVASELAEIMDVALVAFPQQGLVRNRKARAALDAALRLGAEGVGGLDPATFDGDREGHLDVVFDLAERHGCRVDIHLHEPGEIGTSTMRAIAARASASGLVGRCAVSHGYALAQVDDAELDRTAAAMAEAGVTVVTSVPGDGRLPPLDRLRSAGVNAVVASDNIRDSWSPFGDADQIARAALAAYCSNWRSDPQLAEALPLVTSNPAKAVGRPPVMLRPGDPADFTLMPVENVGCALTSPSRQRTVVHRGCVIARDGDLIDRLAGR